MISLPHGSRDSNACSDCGSSRDDANGWQEEAAVASLLLLHDFTSTLLWRGDRSEEKCHPNFVSQARTSRTATEVKQTHLHISARHTKIWTCNQCGVRPISQNSRMCHLCTHVSGIHQKIVMFGSPRWRMCSTVVGARTGHLTVSRPWSPVVGQYTEVDACNWRHAFHTAGVKRWRMDAKAGGLPMFLSKKESGAASDSCIARPFHQHSSRVHSPPHHASFLNSNHIQRDSSGSWPQPHLRWRTRLQPTVRHASLEVTHRFAFASQRPSRWGLLGASYLDPVFFEWQAPKGFTISPDLVLGVNAFREGLIEKLCLI